ncbi:hypothetical protein [Burkholderia ambifaria]|uniref:hypothetical protein n=1 Tax=Burkholderia ambifaria TaxID=152480 RepID=UPI001B9D0D09|nr:hypothetical protein [Burkholderia ambifaria]MBR8179683.1 hypothetical protein [Burkholderia ambifaria]
MSLQKIGLRYERLLVLSAPISLACILVAFVAIASDFAKEKADAQCRDNAAGVVERNKEKLQESWNKRETIGKVTFANEYVYETSMLMIGALGYPCDYSIGRQDTTSALSPDDFAEKLRKDAARIRDQSNGRPVRSYGIEIPDKATINLFGTSIKIGIYTLAQVMQVVLFPIIILWLGSLFNTRYRETVLIGGSGKISDLYPHVINIYLNATLPPLRKRSRIGYLLKICIPCIPSIFRAVLLCIFIAPPTAFYCASLFFLVSDDNFLLSIASGLLVFVFFATNALLEFAAWHLGKTFPTPKSPSSFS